MSSEYNNLTIDIIYSTIVAMEYNILWLWPMFYGDNVLESKDITVNYQSHMIYYWVKTSNVNQVLSYYSLT